MNEILVEWISKAEGDYGVAQREMKARGKVSYDAICFHCQQMVEKYMKAFLYKNNIDFPKTHNLLELLDLCSRLDPSLNLQKDLLVELDRYGVRYRYPGVSAEKEDAKSALSSAKILRDLFRMKIGVK
jgi:HEPN domain-containing protein